MAIEQMVTETYTTLAQNTMVVFLAAQVAADGYVFIKFKNWWAKN